MVSPLGRVVEITEEGRHLSKDRGFLVVQAGREEAGRVPLDDLMAVMATARGTSVSVALLSALADRGVPFIVPGTNFSPAALLWPVEGHHAVSRRMAVARQSGWEQRGNQDESPASQRQDDCRATVDDNLRAVGALPRPRCLLAASERVARIGRAGSPRWRTVDAGQADQPRA